MYLFSFSLLLFFSSRSVALWIGIKWICLVCMNYKFMVINHYWNGWFVHKLPATPHIECMCKSQREDMHIIICVCVLLFSSFLYCCGVLIKWRNERKLMQIILDKMLVCVYLCVLWVRSSKFVFNIDLESLSSSLRMPNELAQIYGYRFDP